MAATRMDDELSSLLRTEFGTPDATVEFLEQVGCTSLPLFATWCNDVAGVETLAGRTPGKMLSRWPLKL